MGCCRISTDFTIGVDAVYARVPFGYSYTVVHGGIFDSSIAVILYQNSIKTEKSLIYQGIVGSYGPTHKMRI